MPAWPGGRLDPALPWLPRLFVLIALPTAVVMALLFPVGEGPDEATQVVRAASVLRGQWIGRRAQILDPADGTPVTVAGVDINPGYLAPLPGPAVAAGDGRQAGAAGSCAGRRRPPLACRDGVR